MTLDRSRFSQESARADLAYAPNSDVSLSASGAGITPVSVSSVGTNQLARAWQTAATKEATDGEADLAARLKEPLEQMRASEEAKIELQLIDLRASQSADRQNDEDAYMAALILHGDKVGWNRSTLGWMVGFPDPDPLSTHKPNASDIFGRRVQPLAKDLRVKIAAAEADFDSVWTRKFAEGEARRKKVEDQLRKTLEVDAETRIAQEAVRLREQAVKSLGTPARRPNLEVTVSPPTVTVSGRTESVTANLPQASLVRSQSDASGVLDQRIQIYLATHHARLATGNEKGRDITSEFSRWLEQYTPGK